MLDREKVIEAFTRCGTPGSCSDRCAYFAEGFNCYRAMKHDLLELLKEQQETRITVDVNGIRVDRVAHWKKDSQFSSVFCSKCGFPAIKQYICGSIPPKQYLSEYCPWCGAKMNEEVKQDEQS